MTGIQTTQLGQHEMSKQHPRLYKAAQELEASFLAEMLKSAGLGKPSELLGGGAGEEQFASFLIKEQAMQMVKAGGIGLTETLFEALKETQNDR